MSTLSVPLSAELERAVESLLQRGFASNKADVAKKAILHALEEEAIRTVIESEQCVREGKTITGNLRNLIQ